MLRFPRYFRFCLLLSVCLFFLPPGFAAPRPVVDAVKLFDKDAATVQKVLGQPVAVDSNQLGEFRDYRSPAGKVTVKFKIGKARSFQLYLSKPETNAAKAVGLLGVRITNQKRIQENPYRVAWRGKFGNPLIKEVSATSHGDFKPGRYGLIVVKDYY